MIEISKVRKVFEGIEAVHSISATISEGAVFGLVGTNGAGKSTLLRMMAGILKPDEGTITLDNEGIFENEETKRKLFFIPDEQYYFPNATALDMMAYYAMIYREFDQGKFNEYMKKFNLPPKRKIHTFSKGMKRQVSILLGMCTNTKYLFCDETFDGLDPVMRQAVKSIFVEEMMNRNFTPVIASHNLRELEDICDHVGLLHQGGILFSRDLEDMKLNVHKVQCVLPGSVDEEQLLKELDVLQYSRSGSLLTITAKGTKVEITQRVKVREPIFWEIVPLTLEEIFISETEVAGYELKNLIC